MQVAKMRQRQTRPPVRLQLHQREQCRSRRRYLSVPSAWRTSLLAKTRKPYRVLISFIVHVWDAGYASTVPARSVARWSNAIHFAVGHLTIACSGCKSKVRSD